MKANDEARIELLRNLCEQAKRLRDDAESLCKELTLQIEQAKRTRGASRPPSHERRRASRPTIIERRRKR